jgi:branched-chain amino acid transport system permease protein
MGIERSRPGAAGPAASALPSDTSLALVRSRRQAVALLGGVGALAVFPWLANPFALDLANQIALACIGALALNLLTGSAGLISLGHAGLLGAGAFTVGILVQELGVPAWLTIPAAVLVGGLLGVIVGLPSLRLKGIYLALSTLALHFVVLFVGSEYQTLRRMATGVTLPDLALGPLVLVDNRAWYYALVVLVTLTALFYLNLLRTRTGRALMALRDRDVAAACVGVNLTAYKLTAFVISACLTSFAGALLAYYQHFVAIEAFNFFVTIQYIAMVLIGGVGSVAGSILGAAFVVALPQGVTLALQALPVPPQFRIYVAAVQFVLFGALMAGFLLFEPGGLVQLWRRLARRWSRPAGRPAPPAPAAPAPRATGGSAPREQAREPAPAAGALLTVDDLTVVYSGEARAVDHLALRVPRGAVVALLGGNGAGKTTTLRALSGFLRTEPARLVAGRIVLDGRDITGLPPHRVAQAGVALVPEREKIFSTLTVEENLAITAGAADPARRRLLREAVAAHFPRLAERRGQRAGLLSGGERQMLALASALLLDPRLLLVDELSLGLAPTVVEQLMTLLGALRRQLGLTILLVEQNAAAALAVADYGYVLSTGRVVKEGTAAQLSADPEVQALYLGIAEGRRSYRDAVLAPHE